ncbi:MAG: PHB depolymerase family esterase [Flammeovirgaceae bacterium]
MKTLNHLLGILLFLGISPLVQAQLTSVSSFGSNPGNLSMYTYVPSGVPSNAPLLVVMHGCTQDANGYANESGWNDLADEHKFYVVYPEQKSGNNSSRCFNWFETGDITRGQGEARSIKAMVDKMKADYSIDAAQVFVTGFSAGGGMTSVMMATYPDVFKGGAVMAGLPYRAGVGLTGAFQAMSPGTNNTPTQWGNLVRNAYSSYNGPYPTLAVFHGTGDFTVRDMNLTELAEQWTNVHGTDANGDQTTTSFQGNSDITEQLYYNGSDIVVATYEINNMGHAIAVDPGSGSTQGGNTGGYATDKNFFSSYWAAKFLGLVDGGGNNGGGNNGGNNSIIAPSNVTATATGTSSIDLAWTDNATGETAYSVSRSTTSGSGFVTIATLPANATAYADNSLATNTTYYYQITVTDGNETETSSEATATTLDDTNGGGSGGSTYTIDNATGSFYLAYTNLFDMGQSFQTSDAGYLTQLDVIFQNAISNSTLRLFEGNTSSGTPIYSQSGISKGSGNQAIAITGSVFLEANTTYTFEISNSSIALSYTNTYNEGTLWYNNFQYTLYDANFVVYLSQNAPSARFGTSNVSSIEADLKQLDFFPNPTRGELSVTLGKTGGEIEILNLAGQSVYRKAILHQQSTLNLAQKLEAGLYLIRLKADEKVLHRRLVIE